MSDLSKIKNSLELEKQDGTKWYSYNGGSDTLTQRQKSTEYTGDVTVSGDLVAAGDLTVSGELTTDGLGATIFSQTVTDEIIDWAGKIDITIPSWATRIELEINGKSGQTGADNLINFRFNGDTGTNYDITNEQITNGTHGASEILSQTECFICDLKDTEPSANYGSIEFNPKNYGRYPVSFGRRVDASAGSRVKADTECEWKNDSDDVTTVNLFTSASTKVSCVITVRAWR